MAKELERRQRGRSFVGPVLLIAIGGVFLLNNFGILPELHIDVLLQLWPLLLILGGIDLIVRGFGRRIGSFLSALVAVGAVVLMGTILLVGDQLPLSAAPTGEVQRETFSVAGDDATAANVRIDLNSAGVDLGVVEDSAALFDGVVYHRGTLELAVRREADRADVTLDTREASFNPLDLLDGTLSGFDDSQRWQLRLQRGVPLALDIDLASGTANLDLAELTLSDFRLDAASGRSEVRLPSGEYDVDLDLASGATTLYLPADGRLNVTVDAASGAMRFHLPPGMPAEIRYQSGSGSLNVDDRFSQGAGSDADDGVWVTDNFAADGDRYIRMNIDMASGSLSVTP